MNVFNLISLLKGVSPETPIWVAVRNSQGERIQVDVVGLFITGTTGGTVELVLGDTQ